MTRGGASSYGWKMPREARVKLGQKTSKRSRHKFGLGTKEGEHEPILLFALYSDWLGVPHVCNLFAKPLKASHISTPMTLYTRRRGATARPLDKARGRFGRAKRCVRYKISFLVAKNLPLIWGHSLGEEFRMHAHRGGLGLALVGAAEDVELAFALCLRL